MSMLDEKRIETLMMKVKDIKTGFGNPRKIGKKEAEELEESLEKYGDFGLFLIDEHDNVIAGNQRLAILQRKDGDIEVLCKRLVGYTKSELRAINIKDNTHSGEWDLEELAKWTADLNIDLGVKLDNKDQMQKTIKEMELIRFEKYDYVLLVCRNELDYNELIRKLGIQGAKVSMGRNRTIKGRAIWYDQIKAQIVEGGAEDGPYTNFKQKVVIFAGASSSDSFKKIRGNSYGMWIATEINLHHDSAIKEAFNRQLAAKNRKIFWDMNPEHPKAPIYENYLDVYDQKAKDGTLKGSYNYAHFTIFENVNITKERLEEIVSQYDENSIWYVRDILGKRSIAEGLVYTQFASLAAMADNPMKITVAQAQEMIKKNELQGIVIGVDFGGNGSGHSFVASAPTVGYGKLVALMSELHKEELDPDTLGKIFLDFVKKVISLFGGVSKVYCDSAEQVLIRGLRTAMARAAMGDIKVGNARKDRINDRIFCFASLVAQGRFAYTELCDTLEDALSMAVWRPNTVELERLDDGTSDIDTLDGFEYSYERDIRNYLKTQAG